MEVINISQISGTQRLELLKFKRTENKRKLRNFLYASLVIGAFLTVAIGVPIMAPMVTPFTESFSWFSSDMTTSHNQPNFIWYWVVDKEPPLQALENAFFSAGIGYLMSAAGLSGILPASIGDIVSQANVLIGESYGGTSLTDSIANIIVQAIGEDMPWWLDWAMPVIAAQALVIASF